MLSESLDVVKCRVFLLGRLAVQDCIRDVVHLIKLFSVENFLDPAMF